MVDGKVDECLNVFVEVSVLAQYGRREVAHLFIVLAAEASDNRKGRVGLQVVLAHCRLPGLQAGCEVGKGSDAVQRED